MGRNWASDWPASADETGTKGSKSGARSVERDTNTRPAGPASVLLSVANDDVKTLASCVSPASGVPVSGFTIVPGVGTRRGSTTVSAGESMRDRFSRRCSS